MEATLADSLRNLLGHFGVSTVSNYDKVCAAVKAECDRLGIDGKVAEFRWGRVTVSCAGPLVPLLATHRDQLFDVASSAAPGEVSALVVRPDRKAPQ